MHSRFGNRTGLTLVEVTASAALLFMLTAALTGAMQQLADLGKSGSAENRLLLDSEDGLRQLARDLRRSGFVEANGKTYPHVFSGGQPGVEFAVHAHVPADKHAPAGHAATGPDQEIVIVLPALEEVALDDTGAIHPLVDAFGQSSEPPAGTNVVKRYSRPILDAAANPVWGAQEISYVLVTAASGENELQRRVDGQAPAVVARGVERVVFETSATNPVEVPLGTVRIRIWFRVRDGSGMWHERFMESTVRLRNGG